MSEETIASAQGNASALVNVIASAPPEQCPFVRVLTPDMELLHFINNDNVMEHAEEMAEAIAELESAQRRLPQMNSAQLRRRGGAIRGSIARNQQRIVELENEILAEINEAQNEYRMLAHSLCEKREEYLTARAVVGNAPITTGNQRRLSRAGVDNSRPNLSRSDMHTILEFERIHGSYKLLESGFAHVTTEEQISRILWAIGRELLIEVVTLGLAKYVRAVRTAASALDRAADALRAAGKAVVVSRYDALPPGVKMRLNNLYRRRRPDNDFDAPDNGTTNTGAARQADEAAQVCRFCP